jgi:hypothetical protein
LRVFFEATQEKTQTKFARSHAEHGNEDKIFPMAKAYPNALIRLSGTFSQREKGSCEKIPKEGEGILQVA